MSWHGYAGDGGGPLPANESLNIQGMAGRAALEKQCRKAQATQARVDARAAAIEARERAAAKAQQALDWDSEVCRKAGVLPGDIEARKRAQEACGGVRNPQASPEPPGNSVTGNCNFDAQGSVLVEQDKALSAILAGMLYDFAGYLTTRPEGFFVGGAYGPQPVIDALVAFAATRGLSLADANVTRWQEALAGAGACVGDARAGACEASVLSTVAKLPDGRGKR